MWGQRSGTLSFTKWTPAYKRAWSPAVRRLNRPISVAWLGTWSLTWFLASSGLSGGIAFLSVGLLVSGGGGTTHLGLLPLFCSLFLLKPQASFPLYKSFSAVSFSFSPLKMIYQLYRNIWQKKFPFLQNYTVILIKDLPSSQLYSLCMRWLSIQSPSLPIWAYSLQRRLW